MSIITRKIPTDIDPLKTDLTNNTLLIQYVKNQLAKTEELEKLIIDYEYGKGRIQEIKIIKDSFIVTGKLKGSFKCSYEINEYSLCAAIDYTTTYSMTIDFEIVDNDLILSGEQRYERSDEI